MSTGRNIAPGLPAGRLDFVPRDALVAALTAWLGDGSLPLAKVLCDRGDASPEKVQLLDALVAEYLGYHGDDPRFCTTGVPGAVPPRDVSLESSAADDGRQTLLQSNPGAGRPAAARTRPEPGGPGGRYRILRPHAKGGLGEVFVAEDRQLGRLVALKEIQNRYADDAASRGRFLVEATITGGLEHPGVVPVYGLGAYPDGRPFYAMRFIQGDNLQEAVKRFHANAPRFDALAFRELLGRFVDACNAVAYAHSRGVLHRDLKPGNVMLGPFGETLVVDWGLAKVTGGAAVGGGGEAPPPVRPAGESAATVTGQALGTPAYMSPEQAGGNPDELGPATDVYGLGATLYELLTGQVPLRGATVGELLDKVKAGRFERPRAVAAALPPALEAVCLKAMALAPADRYDSPLALARDIERWQADEPVTAYREPAAQRLRRWAKRHRTLVTGAAVALLVGAVCLGTAALVLAGFADRERRAKFNERSARQYAEGQRDAAARAAEEARRHEVAATREARKAREVRQFLADMFTAADPVGIDSVVKSGFREGSAPSTTRELVEQAGRHLREAAFDDPAVRAEVVDTLGDLYRTLGQLDRAEALLKEGLSLRETLADNPLDLAVSLQHVGWLRFEQGRFEEAEGMYRRALGIRREHLPADHADILDSMFHLAWLAAMSDDMTTAEQLLLDLLDRRRATLGDEHRATIFARIGLASVYLERNHVAQAATQLGPILEYVKRSASANQIDEALANFQTGVMMFFQRQYVGSVAKVRVALRIAEAQLGPDHHYTAMGLYQLGLSLERAGDLDGSEAALRRCLAIVRKRIGLQHPKVINLVRVFADLLVKRGKSAEGEALFHELFAAHEPYADGRFLADAYVNYAGYLEDNDRDGEALDYYRRAVPIYRRTGAERRKLFAVCLNRLGFRLNRAGGAAEAEALLAEALPLFRKQDGPRHVKVALALTNLAEARLSLGRVDGVEALLAEARDIHRPPLAGLLTWAVGEIHPQYANTLRQTSRLARATGRPADAVKAADEIRQTWPNAPDKLFTAAAELAACSACEAAPADADRLARRAVELLRVSIVKGNRKTSALRLDPNLDALRRRADFADLLWDVADGPGV